MYNFNNIS